jgi:hypothetical protein
MTTEPTQNPEKLAQALQIAKNFTPRITMVIGTHAKGQACVSDPHYMQGLSPHQLATMLKSGYVALLRIAEEVEQKTGAPITLYFHKAVLDYNAKLIAQDGSPSDDTIYLERPEAPGKNNPGSN